MSRNIDSYSTTPCTGCGVCSAVCPTQAIKIEENSEGFLSPKLDSSKCVDCGLCQKVCYKFVATATLPSIENGKCFAVCSNDEQTLRTTTSGGFAYELSKWGLANGYKIVGVKYDYDTDRARMVIADNIDDLELLKGSKYIQSYTADTVHTILKLTAQNPEQGFICFGTPCQIFGLRQAVNLKQLTNDFIFVDLFCHGVPSYLVWDPYIKGHCQRLGKLSNVTFRYKGNGWHQYTIRLVGERGTYCQYAYRDCFYRYFFDNVALNTSCFSCALRRDTASDIRIGDFLGPKYEHREDGVSAIIVNSEKGKQIISKLQQQSNICFIAEHRITDCLHSQSPDTYQGIQLRNSVIERLMTHNTHRLSDGMRDSLH